METNDQPQAGPPAERKIPAIKVFGVGNAGLAITEQLIAGGLPAAAFVAVNSGPVQSCAAAERLQIETRPLLGLASGGDPERGRAMAEAHSARLRALCQGAEVVFIVAGLGGGCGTGLSPVLARLAREAGALVLAFVTTPFDCEGSRRAHVAQTGFAELKQAADAVICLPNPRVSGLIDENTSVLDTFKLSGQLMAEGVLGIWRLLTHEGLIEIHPDQLCSMLRGQHAESAFATAQAMGPTRSREVIDKLLAHPLLDQGRTLTESESVLVSLMGGPDLTMAEVNRVVEELSRKCECAQVIMGAAIDNDFRDTLAVTLIAARPGEAASEVEPGPRRGAEPLDTQLLDRNQGPRHNSRFVPPPPSLAPEQIAQMAGRRPGAARGRRTGPKMRQGQLPLEIVSKGRFDKSEPTIHRGEDLDVPTYIRRGVSLN